MATEAVPRLVPQDLAEEEPVQQSAPRMPNPESATFNPYLAARREWDERYGSLITRARNWRFAAFLALGIGIIETGGLVALAMRSKVIPFVVAVDNLGRVVASGTADQVSAADHAVHSIDRLPLRNSVAGHRSPIAHPLNERRTL